MKKNPTKVIIPCRFSYLYCWEPSSVNGGEPKYSVSAIIPKSDKHTLNLIKAAIEQAKQDSLSKWGGKIPTGLKIPLRDGDEDRPDDAAYADSYFVNANSARKPEIVDLHGARDLGPNDVYSGCYARVSINFFAYSAAGNRGIGCGLGNIQKLDDGEPLGGFSRAEDDFDFEDSAEDMSFLQ